MKPLVRQVPAEEVIALRARYLEETNAQVVHDSIHRRPGWTLIYLIEVDGWAVGFAEVAIGGPWKGKPTVFELYLLPEQRLRAFELFEAFLVASGVRFFEAQTNCGQLGVMVHVYSRDITSEKIVFRDGQTTALPANGAVLRRLTPLEEIREAIEDRQGGGEWQVELDGTVVGKGGILFHYNRPYGDIYMDVAEPHRRRGLGAWLVQELKRECYEFGAVPAARCSPDNVGSRRTLQKAGFVPCGHILIGAVA
jgi:GNAT superfamily N-acetyltransferase